MSRFLTCYLVRRRNSKGFPSIWGYICLSAVTVMLGQRAAVGRCHYFLILLMWNSRSPIYVSASSIISVFQWRSGYVTETSCDGGYVHKSTCYKIHTERVRWFTAVNRCLSNNASLAVFDDDSVVVTRDLVPTYGLWVGLIKSWWTWRDAGDYIDLQ